ncbi:MAG: SOS response-associated peptidase [Opitutales bacterium]
MCGRFTLYFDPARLRKELGCELPADYEPSYNIAPGRSILALRSEHIQSSATPVASLLHWGLRTPHNFLINARSETADTLPRFRESWAARRCLAPANGYYEWTQQDGKKQPFHIHAPDHSLLFFGALWFPSDKEGGPDACVILTTAADATIANIHHRMPVLLPPEAHDAWLQGSLSKNSLDRYHRKARLHMHPVSRRVNRTQNDDPQLMKPAPPDEDEQMRLFE